MGFLLACFFGVLGFSPLSFFNPFKTGVALHNPPLFPIQSEMIECKANKPEPFLYFMVIFLVLGSRDKKICSANHEGKAEQLSGMVPGSV